MNSRRLEAPCRDVVRSVERRFSRELLTAMCAIAISLLTLHGMFAQRLPAETTSTTTGPVDESFAVIQSATYEARFENGDFVDGTFHWQVLRRGTAPTQIDLTTTNLSLTGLQTRSQNAIWGTNRWGAQLVVITQDEQPIDGTWSRHGRTIQETTLIKCRFPHALKTELVLSLPAELSLTASSGALSAGEEQDDSRIWRLDLGRYQSVTLTVAPDVQTDDKATLFSTTQSVYVVRRDGIFLQCDLTVEGNSTNQKQLTVLIPEHLEIQSISSAGVPLKFRHRANSTGQLLLDIQGEAMNRRVTLRIQGVRPLRLRQMILLPHVTLAGGHPYSREVSVRIDAPLELQDLKLSGFIQTALTSESASELWKFQATREQSTIHIQIREPRSPLSVRVQTTLNHDTALPWSVSHLSINAENGSSFDLSLIVPEQWQVVTVVPDTSFSQVASWVQTGENLTVTFQNPITTSSSHEITLFARTRRIETGDYAALPVIGIQDGRILDSQLNWILPDNMDVELISNRDWSDERTLSVFENAHSFPIDTAQLQGRRQQSFHKELATGDVDQPFHLQRIDSTQDEPLEEMWTQTNPDTETALSEKTDDSESFGEWQIITQIEDSNSPGQVEIVHHAHLRFSRPVSMAPLNLALSEDCQLSAVSVDGRPIVTFPQSGQIQFPSEIQHVSELELVYLTQSGTGLFHQQCTVPLPQINIPIHGMHWELNLLDGQRFTRAELPGIGTRKAKATFFFGPLTGEGLASLEEFSAGTGTLSAKGMHHSRDFQTVSFLSPQTGSEIVFDFWNFSFARNIAWSAFFLCVLLGIGGRMQSQIPIKRAVPFWILFLLFSQCFLTNAWSLIFGAMLSGSLIASLFPIRLPEKSKVLFDPAIKRATASGIAVIIFYVGPLSVDAQQEFAGPVSTEQLQAPATTSLRSMTGDYLLRSAKYELLRTIPSHLVRATITALVRNSETNIAIPFFFENVTFSSSECRVDGKEQSLIPHTSGTGVIVNIAPSMSSSRHAVVDDWSEHVIELELSLEHDRTSEEPFSTAIFPSILDSSLVFPGRFGIEHIQRDGQLYGRTDESVTLDLGSVSTFELNPDSRVREVSGLRASTMLNVSPINLSGSTLFSTSSPYPDQYLVLRIPPSVLIQSVSGNSVQRWLQTNQAAGTASLIVEFAPNRLLADSLTIDYLIPIQKTPDGLTIVPALDWSSELTRHLVGLQSPPSINFSIDAKNADYRTLPLSTLAEIKDFPRARPTVVLDVSPETQLRLKFEDDRPIPVARSSDVLTIHENDLNWKSNLQINYEDVPVFLHKLQVTNGLTVHSIIDSSLSSGAPLRFQQSDRDVTVYVPQGQLGRRSLELRGSMTISPTNWQTIPTAQILESDLQSHNLTLIDYTNWNLELQTRSGETQRQPPLPDYDPLHPRVIAVPQNAEDREFTRLRLTPPPSSIHAQAVVRIPDQLETKSPLLHLFRLTTERGPVRSATIEIPKSFGDFRIRPRFKTQTIQDSESSTTIEIEIPERAAFDPVLSIMTGIPAEIANLTNQPSSLSEPVPLPEILINGHSAETTWLLVPKSSPVMVSPTTGIGMEAADAPEWWIDGWQQSLLNGSLKGYERIADHFDVSPQESAGQNMSPIPKFAETVLWPNDAENRISATTRLWILNNDLGRMSFKFPPSIEIKRVVSLDASTARVNREQHRIFCKLDSTQPVIVIEIDWNAVLPETNQIKTAVSQLDSNIPHLVGMVGSRSSSEQFLSSSLDSRFDVLMARWDALLKVSSGIQTPLSIENQLTESLRATRRELSIWLEHHKSTDAERAAFSDIDSRSQSISEQTVISADPKTRSHPKLGLPVLNLISASSPSESTDWTLGTNHDPIQLSHRRLNSEWNLRLVIAIAVLLAVGLFGLYRKSRISTIYRYLDAHPEFALVLLAILWGCFFSPQLASLVFLAAALLIAILTRTNHKLWNRDSLPETPSSRGTT